MNKNNWHIGICERRAISADPLTELLKEGCPEAARRSGGK